MSTVTIIADAVAARVIVVGSLVSSESKRNNAWCVGLRTLSIQQPLHSGQQSTYRRTVGFITGILRTKDSMNPQ